MVKTEENDDFYREHSLEGLTKKDLLSDPKLAVKLAELNTEFCSSDLVKDPKVLALGCGAVAWWLVYHYGGLDKLGGNQSLRKFLLSGLDGLSIGGRFGRYSKVDQEKVIDKVGNNIFDSVSYLKDYSDVEVKDWFLDALQFSFRLEGFVNSIEIINVSMGADRLVCIDVPKLELCVKEIGGDDKGWLLEYMGSSVGKACGTKGAIEFLMCGVVDGVQEVLGMLGDSPDEFMQYAELDESLNVEGEI